MFHPYICQTVPIGARGAIFSHARLHACHDVCPSVSPSICTAGLGSHHTRRTTTLPQAASHRKFPNQVSQTGTVTPCTATMAARVAVRVVSMALESIMPRSRPLLRIPGASGRQWAVLRLLMLGRMGGQAAPSGGLVRCWGYAWAWTLGDDNYCMSG